MTSYFIFDCNGVRKPGSFPYGTLLKAIKVAVSVDGVIYRNDGMLVWESQDINYRFHRPRKINHFGSAKLRKHHQDIFCMCDQCQSEWK